MKSQIKYILIFFCGFIVAQGNFQILTIPANTRMLSLSNAGHAMNSLSSSTHNVASLNTDNRLNINFNSHIYPASILYFNTEARIPLQNFICSFNYANLNYGEFKDAESVSKPQSWVELKFLVPNQKSPETFIPESETSLSFQPVAFPET